MMTMVEQYPETLRPKRDILGYVPQHCFSRVIQYVVKENRRENFAYRVRITSYRTVRLDIT